MLHAAFVRSPHAHARIRAIDASAASAAPGVDAVLTYARSAGDRCAARRCRCWCRNPAIKQPLHASTRWREDEVCFVGEPVAIVIADNRYVAEDAAGAGRGRLRGAAGGGRLRATRSKPGAPLAHSGATDNIAADVLVDVRRRRTRPSPMPRMSSSDASVSIAAARHSIECRGGLRSHDKYGGMLTI